MAAMWELRPITLLRQGILPFDMDVPSHTMGTCVGLASPYADGVVPLWDDDWFPFLSHHTQVARFQIEMHFLARAWIEMNAFESTQSNAGRALDRRELEIELNYLVTCDLTSIGHSHIGPDRLFGSDGGSG